MPAGILLQRAPVHVAVLSTWLGFRHRGYVLIAALSETLGWARVYFRSEVKRRKRAVTGGRASMMVQHLSEHFWKAQLSEGWWPLGRVAAIDVIVSLSFGGTPR